jgi:hypothetical protein
MPHLSTLTGILPALVVLIVLAAIILPQAVRILREIASEHNTTTFLPVPIDLFTPFLKGASRA